MANLQMETLDRRTITLPFPVSGVEIGQALAYLDPAYELTDATLMQSGDQRDPYTIGVRLVLTRKVT